MKSKKIKKKICQKNIQKTAPKIITDANVELKSSETREILTIESRDTTKKIGLGYFI